MRSISTIHRQLPSNRDAVGGLVAYQQTLWKLRDSGEISHVRVRECGIVASRGDARQGGKDA